MKHVIVSMIHENTRHLIESEALKYWP